MASNSEIKDLQFTWKIEHFDAEAKDPITSPTFKAEAVNDTEWNLLLWPNGNNTNFRNFFAIYLNRIKTVTNFNVNLDYTISILATDVSSNVTKKFFSKYFPPSTRHGFGKFVRREKILSNRSLYLPEDVLTIKCYMVVRDNVEDIGIAEDDKTFLHNGSYLKTLNNDLLNLYIDSKFCDVKIRTSDEIFPVHKNILCARSLVFLAMFENDTKEKISGIVDIADIDSETLNLMLTFMYSDSVQDLDQDNALKLYAAADKYEILPLKHKCSAMLKSVLSDANLYDIYNLADMHQDEDLKAAVQDYVYVYSNRLFLSIEWGNFMKYKPHLSSEIMHKLWVNHLCY